MVLNPQSIGPPEGCPIYSSPVQKKSVCEVKRAAEKPFCIAVACATPPKPVVPLIEKKPGFCECCKKCCKIL